MVALPRRVFVSSVGGGAGNDFGAEGAAAILRGLVQRAMQVGVMNPVVQVDFDTAAAAATMAAELGMPATGSAPGFSDVCNYAAASAARDRAASQPFTQAPAPAVATAPAVTLPLQGALVALHMSMAAATAAVSDLDAHTVSAAAPGGATDAQGTLGAAQAMHDAVAQLLHAASNVVASAQADADAVLCDRRAETACAEAAAAVEAAIRTVVAAVATADAGAVAAAVLARRNCVSKAVADIAAAMQGATDDAAADARRTIQQVRLVVCMFYRTLQAAAAVWGWGC